MWEKLKQYGDIETAYLALLLVLVAVTSFGLGRRSVAPEAVTLQVATPPAVQIFRADTPPTQSNQIDIHTVSEPPTPGFTEPAAPTVVSAPAGELIIASRNGTRYHLASCPGAKQITEANRITFTSRAAAEAAGYTPAANCPGLQ